MPENPNVQNFYYGPNYSSTNPPPLPPTAPASCNYNPPPPSPERRPLGFWSIAAICFTVVLIIGGILTYFFATDNGMVTLKQGEKLFNPTTSKMYEYDIDAKNIDANVTIEGYKRDIELAKINAKNNCSKSTGKRWVNYTTPVNYYNFEQTQSQTQENSTKTEEVRKEEPPPRVKEEPKKDDCGDKKEKIINKRSDERDDPDQLNVNGQ